MTERTFRIEDDLQRHRLQQFIGSRKLPFQVDLGDIREQRTIPQNSRLWALHQLAAAATGHTPDEMHEFALCRHFGSREVNLGGVIRQIPNKRSSAREKKEFNDFMESTESWYAAEFGVWLGQGEAA